MSGLLFLSAEDFELKNVQNADQSANVVMTHAIPGFSLILFYSTHCEYCKNIIPMFKTLCNVIGGCSFGMVNVNNNKRCVEMSKNTSTCIKYVPYILLYINGMPYMEYKDDCSVEAIKDFIIKISNDFRSKQSFTDDKKNKNTKPHSKEIPKYCTGHPIKGSLKEQVCYLDWGEAYVAK